MGTAVYIHDNRISWIYTGSMSLFWLDEQPFLFVLSAKFWISLNQNICDGNTNPLIGQCPGVHINYIYKTV